jgi:hypothetical protein
MRQVGSSVVLCLGLNPNCSFGVAQTRLLRKEAWRVGYFRKACQSYLVDIWVDKTRAAPDPSRVSGMKTRRVFPSWEVLGSKNRVKLHNEKGDDS